MRDFDAVLDKASELNQRFKGNSDEVTFWWAPRGETVEFKFRYPNAAFALRIWLARNSVPFLSSDETREFTEDEIEGARSFITS
jgi:hypothetical protein